MRNACVGFLELATIAKGIEVLDAILKKASVKIALASPVSSGKYLLAFEGEVEEVKSAFLKAKDLAATALVDSFFLPNLHPDILPALEQKKSPSTIQALGILETVTCSLAVVAVDTALKTSKVSLLQLHLAKGIGGKAYFIIEGEVGEIESAMSAAVRAIQKQGIIEKVIIPQASPSLLSAIFMRD